VYNIRASYADELEKIVEHYNTFGIKRFSIVYYDDAVGKENLSAVERALKKRNLAAVSVGAFKDRAKPDIDGGVKEVIKGTPEVVILTTLYKHSSDFIKSAQKAGSAAQMVSNSFPGASPLAKELGKSGAGVAIAQDVPPPTKRSVPVVKEYQAAARKAGFTEYTFGAMEGFLMAKVMVEGLRRAGRNLTREGLVDALEKMNDVDLGGFFISYSPKNHSGSKFVDITIIGREGKFLR